MNQVPNVSPRVLGRLEGTLSLSSYLHFRKKEAPDMGHIFRSQKLRHMGISDSWGDFIYERAGVSYSVHFISREARSALSPFKPGKKVLFRHLWSIQLPTKER